MKFIASYCKMKALILIDIQNGLTKNRTLYNGKFFFDTINNAVKNYRDPDSKVIFVQHNNKQLRYGTSVWEIDERIKDLIENYKEKLATLYNSNSG